MKIENWLEEDSIDIVNIIGLDGFILSLIPGVRASELQRLLWAINWARSDAEMWKEECQNADNEIWKHHAKIEWSCEELKALDFIDLYNHAKYFWMRKIIK